MADDAVHPAGVAAEGEMACEDSVGLKRRGRGLDASVHLRDPNGKKICVQHRSQKRNYIP